ncbi:MAG: glycosyltransferase [Candidatus Kerfeldbacteria bacterium]|nr:glycosyltransferase [Candidatus Kerfeldbacteria bacterium]
MTRFALVTEFYPPEHGGIQLVTGQLAEALGPDLTVVTRPQPGDSQFDQARPVAVVRRSLFVGRSWPRWWWLVRWLHQAKRDGLEEVIFGHMSMAVMAGWLASRTGLRYSILVHGNDVLSETRRWPGRWWLRLIIRRAAWIGVNSHFVADLVRQHGGREYQFVYSHPWADVSVQPSTSRQSAQVITMSRLVARKNIATVIRAIQLVRTAIPSVHYDVVGDGPERVPLERLTAELGLSDCVTFHGSIDDIQKQQLLSSATVFVMVPTTLDQGVDVEGLGTVYLEAGAAGLPLIAARSGGVTDAVVDGQTGIFVEPTDHVALGRAIQAFLQDPTITQAFGQRSRQRVEEEFSRSERVRRIRARLGLEQPLVSVVIPAFQAAHTIGQTLKKLFAQTYKRFEVIVVDDGSTDDLSGALKPYADRIHLIRQTNSGAPVARNAGAAISKGDWLLFLDADVELIPSALTDLVEVGASRPDCSFVFPDFYFGWKKFHLFDFSVERLRRQNYIHTTALIRRTAFTGFDPDLKKFQDWDLWLTLAEQDNIGVWLPRPLFRINTERHGLQLSTWLPSFVYRLPLIGQGRGNATVAAYRRAEAIVKHKHGLNGLRNK